MVTARRPSTTSSRKPSAARTKTTTSGAVTEPVTPDVELPKSPPLVESAASGSRLAALRDLRDLIARTITATDSARDVAALSRQLTDVLGQIEDVEKAAPEQKGTPLDELARRRSVGQSVAKGRPRAEGGRVAR
jgi:hypothetical protein